MGVVAGALVHVVHSPWERLVWHEAGDPIRNTRTTSFWDCYSPLWLCTVCLGMGIRDEIMVTSGGPEAIILLGKWVVAEYTTAPAAKKSSSTPTLSTTLRVVVGVDHWDVLVVGGVVG